MTRDKLLSVLGALFITLYPVSIRAQGKSWQKNIEAGNAALELRQLEEAEKSYQAALKDAEKFDSSDPRLTKTLKSLASVYESLGKHPQAEALYKRMVRTAERLMENAAGAANSRRNERTLETIELGPGLVDFTLLDYQGARRQLTESLRRLARSYQAQNKFSDAEQVHLRLISILKKALSEPGSGLNGTYEFREKKPNSNEETVVVRSKKEQELWENREALAGAYEDLAALHLTRGNTAAAEPLYQQSLLLRADSPESLDPGIAVTLGNMAILHASKGQYDKAETLFRRALTIFEKALDPEHPKVAGILENYGLLLNRTGRPAEAEQLYQRAEKIREKNKRR